MENQITPTVTPNLVARINEGCATLSILEKRLVDYLDKNKEIIKPDLLLDVCKYIRLNINMETKMILDYALKAKEKTPKESPVPDDVIKDIQALTVHRRDNVLSVLSDQHPALQESVESAEDKPEENSSIIIPTATNTDKDNK